MCSSDVPEKPTSVDELPTTEWGVPYGTIYDEDGNMVRHISPAPEESLDNNDDG